MARIKSFWRLRTFRLVLSGLAGIALLGCLIGAVAFAQLPVLRSAEAVRLTRHGIPGFVEGVVVRSTADSLTVASLPDSVPEWPGVIWLNANRVAAWPQRTYTQPDLRRLEASNEVRRAMQRGALFGELTGSGVGARLGWAFSDEPRGGAALGALALGWFGAIFGGSGAEARWPAHWRTVYASRP